MEELERALQELERADVVAFGGVGFAGEVLSVTRAFDAIVEQLSPELHPRLDRLFDRASPAGRVYAAVLLGRIDPDAGRHAWQRLEGDRAPVETFSGCVKNRTTLAEYAAAQNEGKPD
ncbi:hypothetical protein HC028_08410 [Planosporangium flavigriseum]|uniref:Uncharacterized protein n=1 Tax=Planosporangium flavigriseum TaxID=373681 RepID=A0A8J3LHV9_9ACTN|nr:hypothetical protein [Planosporangium flavigriseum]NJC64526.1 hypothetical protein [Planosporangium flavigriseum]GIG71992.1 hypothetical protein Pfl04_03960 [Planosporangium flavigriseum]